MKKIIILFLIAVIIIAVLIIPFGQSDVVESSFGEWKIEVEVGFADGTTEKLSVANNLGGQMLAFFNKDGKEVTTLICSLYAKATGSGYTGCELNLYDMWFNPHLISVATNGDDYFWTYQRLSSSYTIPLNQDFQLISKKSITISDAKDVGNGDYNLFIGYAGDIKYRGLPDGSWQTDMQSIKTIVYLTKSESGGGGTEPPEELPGCWPNGYPVGNTWPDGNGNYLLQVATAPTADKVWASPAPGEMGPPAPVYDCDVVNYLRPPGTYSVYAEWNMGNPEPETRQKTVTITNKGILVLLSIFPGMSLKSMSFVVDTSGSEISEYRYGDSYLGG